MTATHKAMARLYRKVRSLGYTMPYIRSLLPEWWDDVIADTPSGFQQASLILGHLFSIQPESLWMEAAEPALVVPQGRKFKQRANTKAQDLDIACALARSAARLVLKAFTPEFTPGFYPDATELRERLLLSGKPWIGFQELLAHCLDSGIPVIFLKHLPRNANKMAGVSFEQDGRPVIVLTQAKPYGYLLFDLAHELGHVSLGHTKGGTWMIDAEIDADTDVEDDEEQAANRYARELVAKSAEWDIVPAGRLYPQQLADIAIRVGTANRIDPLHIALSYGYRRATHWPVATEATKAIAQGRTTDQQTLIEALLASLDAEAMSEDDLLVLRRLMGEVAV